MNILYLAEPREGSHFYRVLVPSDSLRKLRHKIGIKTELQMHLDKIVDWDFKQADIIIKGRFSEAPMELEEILFKQAHEQGKKIIFDTDDNLWDLPKYSTAYPDSDVRYESWLDKIKFNIEEADAVTVTTENLKQLIKEQYPKAKDKIFVIPNRIPEKFIQISKRPIDDTIRIGITGSPTHLKDYIDFWPILLKIKAKIEKKYHIRFVITGIPINELSKMATYGMLNREQRKLIHWASKNMWNKRGPDLIFLPGCPFDKWFEALKVLDFDIGLIPLSNNIFNLGKSNCKWIEYSILGTAVIASDHPVYAEDFKKSKGGILCSSTKEWIDAVDNLCESAKYRLDLNRKALKYIKKHYVSERHEKKLGEFFESLISN